MSEINKRIITCDLCKKENSYDIYSIDDLEKIPTGYTRLNITTPDFKSDMLGHVDTNILICASCVSDVIFNRAEKFKHWIKKYLGKKKPPY